MPPKLAPIDSTDDEGAYQSRLVWPADPRDLRAEHDAAAGTRVFRIYVRDSHNRGIGVVEDEHAVSRAKRLKREANEDDNEEEDDVEEVHEKILAAMRGGELRPKYLAKVAGKSPANFGRVLQVLVDAGHVEKAGAGGGTKYWLKGTPMPEKIRRESASVDRRPLHQRAPKAKPAKPPAAKRVREEALLDSAFDELVTVRDPAMIVRLLGGEVHCDSVEQVIALARAAAQS